VLKVTVQGDQYQIVLHGCGGNPDIVLGYWLTLGFEGRFYRSVKKLPSITINLLTVSFDSRCNEL